MRGLTFLVLAVSLVGLSNLLGDTSLAILTGPGLENEGVLLAAALSRDGCSLVERDEIDRIAEERAVVASPENAVKVGRLVGANLVISLRKISVGGESVLATSIMAVEIGVRVSSNFDALPLGDIEKWADRVGGSLQESASKSDLRKVDAVALSVLSLRAPLDTPQARQMEVAATALLIHGLTKQKDFFVMERQSLDVLAMENGFSSKEENAFWIGRRVINGSIQKVENDRFSLVLQIEQMGRGEDSQISVEAGDLNSLINDAVENLAIELGKLSAPLERDAQEEAKRYFEEAQSATAASIWKTALPAAESAATLGLENEELERLLVKLNVRAAFPEVESWEGSAKKTPWSKDAYKLGGSDVDIEKMQRALDIFLRIGTRITKPTRRWDEDSIEELGAEVVLAGSRVLRAISDEEHAKYRDLREQTRAAADLLFERADPRRLVGLNQIMAVYAPYWENNPERVFRRYRTALDAPLGGSIHQVYLLRYIFANVRDGTKSLGPDSSKVPWLVESPGEWQPFVKALRESPRLQDQLDALLIEYCSSEDPQRGGLGEKIEDKLWGAREELFETTTTAGQFLAFVEMVPLSAEFKAIMATQYFDSDAPFSASVVEACRRDISSVSTDLAARLLAAASSYRNRMNDAQSWVALSDPRDMAAFERSLVEQFPALANPERWPALVVDEVPSRLDKDSVIEKVIWREGRLWVLAMKLSREQNEMQILSSELRGGGLEVGATFLLPEAKLHYSSANIDTAFDVSDRWLAVVHAGVLHVMNRGSGEWASTSVPSSPWPALRILQGAIYYAYPGPSGVMAIRADSSGIVRIDPESLTSETLASSRRKPERNPLDDVEPYQIFSIAEGPEQQIFVTAVMDCNVWKKGTKIFVLSQSTPNWGEVFAGTFREWRGAFAIEHRDEVLFQAAEGQPSGAFRWAEPGGIKPILRKASKSTPGRMDEDTDLIGEPSFRSPVLAGQNNGAYCFLSKRGGKNAAQWALMYYANDTALGSIIPLDFVEPSAVAPRSVGLPSLIATEEGLVLWGYGLPPSACWFIPNSRLESHLADNVSGE